MIGVIARLLGVSPLILEGGLLVLLGLAAWGVVARHDYLVATAATAKVEAAVAKATAAEKAKEAAANAAAAQQAAADEEWIKQLADERDAVTSRLDDEIDKDAAAATCGLDADGVRRLNAILGGADAAPPRPVHH